MIDFSIAIAVFIFIFTLYTPAMAFSGMSSQLRIMESGLNRYEDILNAEEMTDGQISEFPSPQDISFENVHFRYDSEDILSDINFNIPEKTTTALVGPSGGGKTTIANLIVRFWDVKTGSIRIGNTDIRDINYDTLLSEVSMVFQNVYLFADTIANNIRFGKPNATMDEIISAAKKARCHDFIMNLPDGYDTLVDEGGNSLSGGERQRISIARAMIKYASIIILDEATASVDPDNEYDIQQALLELIKNKTLIMIAHRLSTIKSADQILFIDNNHVIESGTHDTLIEQKGPYFELWNKRQKASGWKL
ncbi:MAG: ABC transporter ATP-binding protein [Suipraeoptans sp.]